MNFSRFHVSTDYILSISRFLYHKYFVIIVLLYVLNARLRPAHFPSLDGTPLVRDSRWTFLKNTSSILEHTYSLFEAWLLITRFYSALRIWPYAIHTIFSTFVTFTFAVPLMFYKRMSVGITATLSFAWLWGIPAIHAVLLFTTYKFPYTLTVLAVFYAAVW